MSEHELGEAAEREAVHKFLGQRETELAEWRRLADECLSLAVRALDLAKELRSGSPDPDQIRRAEGLEDLAHRIEAKEFEVNAGALAHLEETAASAQQLHHMRRAIHLVLGHVKRIEAGEILDDQNSPEARELDALVAAIWVEVEEYPNPLAPEGP